MKKPLLQFRGLIILLVFLAGTFIISNPAHAQDAATISLLTTVATKAATGGAGFISDAVSTLPGYLFSGVVLPVVSWLTSLAGIALNYSINQTVLQMATSFSVSSSGIGASINSAWGTIRDIVNMFFIFILLYTAIMTMFGRGDYKKTIVYMVIAAILINFSLLFTQVVIDAGNLLALTFYNAIAPNALAATDVINTGLSGTLMNQLHLSTIWEIVGTINGTNLLIIGILGSFFCLAAAFVFFAAALMFVIRYVVLIFVLILSPLMFLGMILPQLGGYTKQWKDALLGQTFFAPIFLLFIWITIKISGPLFAVMNAGNPNPDMANALTPTYDSAGNLIFNGGAFGIVLNFIIVITFLIFSIIVAKKVSDKSGSVVGKINSWAMGVAPNLVGSLGRNTVGRGANALLNSTAGEALKDKAKENSAAGMAARLALRANIKASKGSFDARATTLGGGISNIAGFGKAGGKGGFAKQVAEDAKQKEEFIKALAPSQVVIQQAKDELEKAKKVDQNSSEFNDERKIAVLTKRAEARKAEEDLGEARRDFMLYAGSVQRGETKADPKKTVEYRETITKAQDKVNEAKRVAEIILSNKGYAQYKIAMAQEKVDKLTGVDIKEGQARVEAARKEALGNDPAIKKQTQLSEEVNALTEKVKSAVGDTKELMEKELANKKQEFELAKIEAENRRKEINKEYEQKKSAVGKIPGAGEVRIRTRAQAMANPGPVSVDRVALVGMIKQSSLHAATNLRKGKKSIEDTLKELVKEETGTQQEVKKEEAERKDEKEETKP